MRAVHPQRHLPAAGRSVGDWIDRLKPCSVHRRYTAAAHKWCAHICRVHPARRASLGGPAVPAVGSCCGCSPPRHPTWRKAAPAAAPAPAPPFKHHARSCAPDGCAHSRTACLVVRCEDAQQHWPLQHDLPARHLSCDQDGHAQAGAEQMNCMSQPTAPARSRSARRARAAAQRPTCACLTPLHSAAATGLAGTGRRRIGPCIRQAQRTAYMRQAVARRSLAHAAPKQPSQQSASDLH
jgi:hypothetical protein